MKRIGQLLILLLVIMSLYCGTDGVLAKADTSGYDLTDYFDTFEGTDLSGLYTHPDLRVFDSYHAEGEHIRADIAEYVYDGHSLYLLLEISPEDEDVFLYDAWDDLDDYVSDIVGQDDSGEGERSYAEYAQQIGKDRFISIEPDFDFESVSRLFSARLYARDGKLLYFVEADPVEMSASMHAVISILATAADGEETLALDCAFASNGSPDVMRDVTSYDIDAVGVRIDCVTVVRTEIATYFTIDYSVYDQKAFNTAEDHYNLWFDVVASDGHKFEGGLLSPAIYRLEEDRFSLMTMCGCSEVIDKTVIVRAFDANSKEVLGETIVQLPSDRT